MPTTILSSADISKIQVNLEALGLLDKTISSTSQILIYARDDKKLKFLTTNNLPEMVQSVVEKFENEEFECELYYTDTIGFEAALTWYDELETYRQKLYKEQQKRKNADGSQAIDLLKKIIANHENIPESDFIHELLRLSYQSWASDIHFQSEESGVYVRLRKDGIMQMIAMFTHESWVKYLMKIKFMSGVKMNVDFLSQDGRFWFSAYNKWEEVKIDVRVSVLPGLRWGSLVLRFLDASKWLISFEQIGMKEDHRKLLHTHMKRQSGLILVTGPTWSGKTTTVYSIISQLNTPKKKIITVEDPVEYELKGIEQSQINAEKWYTFEEWLKGILRHDPDIIMVWEIRSLETAEMAINAALTWHLVISTLHTNSAIESIARLVNMWVKPYMLASALNLIVWQRLIRKIADPVSIKTSPGDDIYIQEQMSEIQKYHDINMNYAGKTMAPRSKDVFGEWYEWRIWLLEMLEIDDVITKAVMSGKDSFEIYQIAYDRGFLTLEHDGIMKLLDGVTSLEEMRRGVGL